jgi:deoxycytidylate deaminase
MEEDNPFPRYLTLAKNVSKHSKYRIKVGAVLAKGNHPVSVGFNKAKFNSKWGNVWRKSIHAECEALRTSGRETLRNSTMYVYREYLDGTPALAKPCLDCQEKMRAYGVRKVYYSTNIYPFYEVFEL